MSRDCCCPDDYHAIDPTTTEAEINPKVKAALAMPAKGASANLEAAGAYGGGHQCQKCEFQAPSGAMFSGQLHFDIYDMDGEPNHVVSIEDGAYVCIHWRITGDLARLICGCWCVQVYLENLGRDKEGCKDITLKEYVCTLECNRGEYWVCMFLPPNRLDPSCCSCLYKLAVSIQLRDCCNKPVPFAGFCEGPVVQFYDPN